MPPNALLYHHHEDCSHHRAERPDNNPGGNSLDVPKEDSSQKDSENGIGANERLDDDQPAETQGIEVREHACRAG